MSRNTLISHVEQPNLSDSDILFLHRTIYSYPHTDEGFSVVRLDNREFKLVTKMETRKKFKVKCTCHGVLLLTEEFGTLNTYTLWNPSTAWTSKVTCMYAFQSPAREGLCYDPITNDIKIVVVAWGYYAVYSCNNNTWTTNGRKVPGCFREMVANAPSPVSVDGAVYWAENHTGEIMCFDPTFNEFKALRKPENVEEGFRLACLGGRLCLWSWQGGGFGERCVQIWMKEKGKDSDTWRGLVTITNGEVLKRAITRFEPLCLVGDKIVIRLDSGVVVVYGPSEDRFEAILIKIPDSIPLIPYVRGEIIDALTDRLAHVQLSH